MKDFLIFLARIWSHGDIFRKFRLIVAGIAGSLLVFFAILFITKAPVVFLFIVSVFVLAFMFICLIEVMVDYA